MTFSFLIESPSIQLFGMFENLFHSEAILPSGKKSPVQELTSVFLALRIAELSGVTAKILQVVRNETML